MSTARLNRRDGMPGNIVTKQTCLLTVRDSIISQKMPEILSEPHFLHGDPQLLKYASSLSPNEEAHSSYVIIEPYTGTPLSGEKKTQLNLYLERQPVELLSNVSEGYFPLMWCSNVRKYCDT